MYKGSLRMCSCVCVCVLCVFTKARDVDAPDMYGIDLQALCVCSRGLGMCVRESERESQRESVCVRACVCVMHAYQSTPRGHCRHVWQMYEGTFCIQQRFLHVCVCVCAKKSMCVCGLCVCTEARNMAALYMHGM